ncbi:MAG TPA: hypothetical protein VK256_04145 [Candidatus Eisenbacteria bacterium]|nr:hypothetical protein [Candidatus Eisenbacteria bacterium]
MVSGNDQLLLKIQQEIAALPELAAWDVEVHRDNVGRLHCYLVNRLGGVELEAPRGNDDDGARLSFLEAVPIHREIAYINAAPPVEYPNLPNNLRAGLSVYEWTFDEYCDILLALHDAGVLTLAEMEWLMVGARDYPGGKPERVENDSDGREIRVPWGFGLEAPWQQDRTHIIGPPDHDLSQVTGGEHEHPELEKLAAQVVSLPNLLHGWKVNISRAGGNALACELEHDLVVGGIHLMTDRTDPHGALRQLRHQIGGNREIATISAAPAGINGKLVGHLRKAAQSRLWRPMFYFELLERLHIGNVLSGQDLLWAMEAGPVGDPGWQHHLAGTAKEEYLQWRATIGPDWRSLYGPKATMTERSGHLPET